jgi:hypothetical protein
MQINQYETNIFSLLPANLQIKKQGKTPVATKSPSLQGKFMEPHGTAKVMKTLKDKTTINQVLAATKARKIVAPIINEGLRHNIHISKKYYYFWASYQLLSSLNIGRR